MGLWASVPVYSMLVMVADCKCVRLVEEAIAEGLVVKAAIDHTGITNRIYWSSKYR
jgi:hypothetical protein